jgi:hypothetical protein
MGLSEVANGNEHVDEYVAVAYVCQCGHSEYIEHHYIYGPETFTDCPKCGCQMKEEE